LDLLNDMVAEMIGLYEITDGHVGVALDIAELAPPTGCYLVGWLGGEPVAGGGIRRLPGQGGEPVAGGGLGEIKRMYVRPDHRGRGVAPRLLAALEAAGADLGYRALRLDTGARQNHARRMYERLGYRSIPDYNDNPHASFWGEKELLARTPGERVARAR
jgi:GNAT superfamily N-acetyltransferase